MICGSTTRTSNKCGTDDVLVAQPRRKEQSPSQTNISNQIIAIARKINARVPCNDVQKTAKG